MMQRGAMWWRSSRLTYTIQLLQQLWHEARRQAAMLAMASTEWGQYESWKAILQWQRKAEQLRMLKAALMEDQALGTKHWNKRNLSVSVGLWYEATYGRLQILQDRRDAILCWAEQQLVACVNQWRQQTYLLLCASDSYRHGVATLTAGLLMDALTQWRRRANLWRANADDGHRRAISKWERDAMAAAFYDWRCGCAGVNQNSASLKTGHDFSNFRAVIDAIVRWRDYAEFCSILAELMQQADFRYKHKSYSDGFQAWRSYSDLHIKMECVDSPEK
jgi:hypothetical protein